MRRFGALTAASTATATATATTTATGAAASATAGTATSATAGKATGAEAGTGTGEGAAAGVPSQRGAARAPAAPATAVVRDLRAVAGPGRLRFADGDIVVVSGLPGGGKSTLIKRAAPGGGIDSQDARERWEHRMPAAVPYAVYRPAVRIAHYWGLWRVLRSGASAVVHDCGTQSWVRAVLAGAARRRGRALHLVLLDTTPEEARSGRRRAGGECRPTPSPGTGARWPGCCARRSRAVRRPVARRWSSWTARRRPA